MVGSDGFGNPFEDVTSDVSLSLTSVIGKSMLSSIVVVSLIKCDSNSFQRSRFKRFTSTFFATVAYPTRILSTFRTLSKRGTTNSSSSSSLPSPPKSNPGPSSLSSSHSVFDGKLNSTIFFGSTTLVLSSLPGLI